jgi:hypothetical protein
LRISGLRQSHSAWAEVGTHIKRRPTSTTFSFRLNLRRASRCACRACGTAAWSGTGASRTAGNAQHRGCSYSKAAGTLSRRPQSDPFHRARFTGNRQLFAGYHRTRSRWGHVQDEAAAVHHHRAGHAVAAGAASCCRRPTVWSLVRRPVPSPPRSRT